MYTDSYHSLTLSVATIFADCKLSPCDYNMHVVYKRLLRYTSLKSIKKRILKIYKGYFMNSLLYSVLGYSTLNHPYKFVFQNILFS